MGTSDLIIFGGRMNRPTSRARPLWVAAALALVLPVTLAPSVASSASTSAITGVGSVSIAQAAYGGRTIYVSPSGSDVVMEWKAWYNGGDWRSYKRFLCLDDPAKQPSSQLECPEPTVDQPLATIQTAVLIAKPGDVIVVRAGSYREAIGWGARAATSAKPIVLQSYPSERVEVRGTLILKSADFWNVRGMRFLYNSAVQSGQSIVTMAGGNGWKLSNNEVAGSVGVANVLITAAIPADSSIASLTFAAPRNFVVNGNCIRNNAGVDALGTDHNIYLMGSIYSTGGIIERNLIAGAPRGSNIKAAASTPSRANDSPRNVAIRYNTLLSSASGVTIGLKAEGILLEKNIIAISNNSQQYDGGVKTYQLASPGKNAAKDTLIYGYARPLSEDFGSTAHIFTARMNTSTAFSYSGSITNCTARAADSTILSTYGQYAN